MRKKELMIRVLKIYYLFIFTILVSCSSEDISQENLDIYKKHERQGLIWAPSIKFVSVPNNDRGDQI